jgi:hypothetical protein
MRVVATQACAGLDRFMHHTLTVRGGELRVAGVAQVLDLLLQKSFKTRNVGAVAGGTVTCRRRFVLDPLLELSALMAGETVDGGLGEALGCKSD